MLAIPKHPVGSLLLDHLNPRLPEELMGHGSQSALFMHLAENDALEEIAESMLDNGFFEHEPLIGWRDSDQGNQVVIVEGNRRLAALSWILGLDRTAGKDLPYETTAAQVARLREVPVYEVGSRTEVGRFLGYRHISGLKPWRSDAKARYLLSEVRAVPKAEVAEAFKIVGRRVGSNALGVRNYCTALLLLRRARDDGRFNIGHVMRKRFGVWLRCMNSEGVKAYFGLPDAQTYPAVMAAVDAASLDRLAEVLRDLTPHGGKAKPLIEDSRQVTLYAEILRNDSARDVLRATESLELAKRYLVAGSFDAKMREAVALLVQLRAEAEQFISSPDLMTGLDTDAVRALAKQALDSAKLLRITIDGALHSDD